MSESPPVESSARPTIDGVFHRSVSATAAARVLDGAATAEGRFHHDGQAALYLSSRAAWAARAMDRYRTPGDPPCVTVPLRVARAAVVDLRDVVQCAALAIDPADASTDWLAQRHAGRAADSWRPADLVRASGADGMIYPSRSSAARWHLVLFRWNAPGGATVSIAGPPRAETRSPPPAERPSWA